MLKAQKTVLIIEDDQSMQLILADKLTEAGFKVFQARNGVEGLAVAFKDHPDIILSDLLMPQMDGMTMLGKLREDTWGKQVPVIILTNVSADTDKTIQAIVAYQPAYYLVKSDAKLEDIVEKVNEILVPKADVV